MAIDLNAPININSVMEFSRKFQNVLVAVDKSDANELLKHLTPLSGITDSIVLGRVEGGTVSRRYNGVFIGSPDLGKIVPRKLTVHTVVAEMDDEPERYRRAYITEVPGNLRAAHPFEGWLLQHGITLASNDLFNNALTAKYDISVPANTSIETAFDGLYTVLQADVTAGAISVANGNLFATGAITRANVGDKLLAMWRSMPATFRQKKNIKMFISADVSDLYDDWLTDESVVTINDDPSKAKFLRQTSGKCELVVLNNLPDGSQFVLLTTQANAFYGFDKAADMKGMQPFFRDPYKFTAAMKYVIGFQVASIHKSELCVNDQPITPVVAG